MQEFSIVVGSPANDCISVSEQKQAQRVEAAARIRVARDDDATQGGEVRGTLKEVAVSSLLLSSRIRASRGSPFLAAIGGRQYT